ncbi:MAG TPA: hypothetical protein VIM84_15430, partial [Gemmatimonadales bacterium]
AELIRQGVDPLEAIDRVTGHEPGSMIDDSDLTAEERLILSAGPEAMQKALDEVSGGQWDDLTEDQRELVLRMIETLAQANRRPDDTGAQ